MEVSYFFGGGGVYLCPTDPLDPLEGVLGGHLLENFPGGGAAQILSLRGGVRPPRTPLWTSMNMPIMNLRVASLKSVTRIALLYTIIKFAIDIFFADNEF